MSRKSMRFLFALLSVVLVATGSFLAVSAVQAKAPPLTKKPSYAEFYSGSNSVGSSETTCTTKGCPNGLKVTWAAASCYGNDRYPPISVIWTVGGNKVATSEWPLTAPCSTGFQFTWDQNNHLNSAKWLGAGSQSESGLAICFQSKKECNAGHCVTAGCVPGKTGGVDIFFQTGDTPTTVDWLTNGKSPSPVSSGSASSVFWYGSTPPSTPYSTTGSNTATSTTVTITGRNSKGDPSIKRTSADSKWDGIDMNWYLMKYDPKTSRGCHEVNGTWYTSPPLAFAYTTNGQLSGPMAAPTCAAPGGTPWPYADLDFQWSDSGSGVHLTQTAPLPFNGSIQKCQGSEHGGTTYPSGNIAQPPAGSNGVILTYAHDDYANTCWTQGSVSRSAPVNHPEHPRLGVFAGKNS